MRICHYGFLANSVRKNQLDSISQLLSPLQEGTIPLKQQKAPSIIPKETQLCPQCHQGYLQVIMHLKKVKRQC